MSTPSRASEGPIAPSPSKLSLCSETNLQRKLAEFVRSAGLGCGLIVVNSVNLERERRRLPPVPTIYVIAVHEMTSKLENSELASWLKGESRNKIM